MSIQVAPGRVSIVIVSWNSGHVLRSCLASIYAHTDETSIEVIVVDNASSDGTVEMVQREFSRVKLIVNATNKGFAAANNIGLECARGQYLLLLNPDTEIHSHTIRLSIAYMEKHPEVGVVGCRCIGADGAQQSSIFRVPRVRDVLINTLIPSKWMTRSRLLGKARYVGVDLDQEQDVEVVAGCYMFLRRSVYDAVGGMDDEFFMYGEEVEWCHRIRKEGWRVAYVPSITILHYGGVSAAQCADEMDNALARSQLLVIRKTRGAVSARAANVLMLLRDVVRLLLFLPLWCFGSEGDGKQAWIRSIRRIPLYWSELVTSNEKQPAKE